MEASMLSPLNLVSSAFVFFGLIQLSEGFVRYSLLTSQETGWNADTLCKDNGYDGLAVINSPAKWKYAKIVLGGLSTDSKAWIGLKYSALDSEPSWIGNEVAYTWGAWGSNQPDWISSTVLTSHDGSDWVWEVAGSNYKHSVLCYRQFYTMGLSRYPNSNINLMSATSEMSETAITVDDCAMKCASLASCDYLTYDETTNACNMYEKTTVQALLATATDTGNANSFSLYSVRA